MHAPAEQMISDKTAVRPFRVDVPGEHKVRIELVDAEGNVFTAQTVTFHTPGKEDLP